MSAGRAAADFGKRILDIVVASAVLVLGSPLWLAIAAAVKLTTPGPALFRMRVVGRDGYRFTMYKFRSMRQDGDPAIHRDAFARFARGEALSTVHDGDREIAVYKLAVDRRVTPVGRLLRKTGLDEIPQFFNVLRGEMSVVGPRPAQEYEYEYYGPEQRRRFAVLPGITGLHQVAGRSRVAFDEMVRLDLTYVDNRSLGGDLVIIARTAWVMLRGRGAY